MEIALVPAWFRLARWGSDDGKSQERGLRADSERWHGAIIIAPIPRRLQSFVDRFDGLDVALAGEPLAGPSLTFRAQTAGEVGVAEDPDYLGGQ